MPLESEDREKVLAYSDRDVPDAARVESYFDFVTKEELRKVLVSEYVAARYIYKLGEALNVSAEKLAAHAKFQIMQYASIYEAVIVYMLWTHFKDRSEVTDIEYYLALKKTASLPNNIVLQTIDDEEVFLCVETKRKNTQHSIKFEDKVTAAVSIGFLDPQIAEEIKEFYRLRNGIHLENAAKNEIEYELGQASLAYRRVQPFTIGIREFLRSGHLPDNARPKNITADPTDSEKSQLG